MPDTQKSEAYRITREYWRLQVQERGIGSVIDEIDGLLKVYREEPSANKLTLHGILGHKLSVTDCGCCN